MPKLCFRTRGGETRAKVEGLEILLYSELSRHSLWRGTGLLCPSIAGTWGTGREMLLPLFEKRVIVASGGNCTFKAVSLGHLHRLSRWHSEVLLK